MSLSKVYYDMTRYHSVPLRTEPHRGLTVVVTELGHLKKFFISTESHMTFYRLLRRGVMHPAALKWFVIADDLV